MDATLAWTVFGFVAGVVVVGAALILLPRRRGGSLPLSGGHGSTGPAALGWWSASFPLPVLDVEVRGREQVIDELTGLARAPPGHAVVLAGLGGSGKSTVARAVAARVQEQDGCVWWVPAVDAVSVTQILLGLARELGASRGQVEEALAGRLNPSDVLWQQLQETTGWLLVLDNADNPAALTVDDRPVNTGSGWLRPTRAGLVLATSRVADPQRWGAIAKVVWVESLSEADGAQVLLDLAPGAGNRAKARSLSAQLGGLPLALHQAGSYLTSLFATEGTFAQYRHVLSVRLGELGRSDEDQAKVITTAELSLDALRAQEIGQARLLLRVLSCFASAVPLPPLLLDRDVLARMCGSTARAEDGLSGLSSVGLISTVGSPQAGALASVKVHPLVAQTTLDRADEDLPESLEAAVRLLSAVTGKLKHEDPGQAADWLSLVPHLRALLSSDARMPAGSEASLANAAARISGALIQGGSYLAALAMAESGLEREHGLALDHQAVLALRSRRALALRFLGHYQGAEAEYLQVLDARLRVLGPYHHDTLITRHEIAATLAARGKPADAEAVFRQVLEARLRVLGPVHPSTLTTGHEIAVALAAQGRAADAEAVFRQVLGARLRVLGPDHPSTLTTRHNMAVALAAQGRPADAEAVFRQVLGARLRVLGPYHHDTLVTRHEVAVALAAQGRGAGAEAVFRQVLDARLQVLGPDHPSTVSTANWLKSLQGDGD
jgi:tetratricopeptide (TPR) repeat protein